MNQAGVFHIGAVNLWPTGDWLESDCSYHFQIDFNSKSILIDCYLLIYCVTEYRIEPRRGISYQLVTCQLTCDAWWIYWHQIVFIIFRLIWIKISRKVVNAIWFRLVKGQFHIVFPHVDSWIHNSKFPSICSKVYKQRKLSHCVFVCRFLNNQFNIFHLFALKSTNREYFLESC